MYLDFTHDIDSRLQLHFLAGILTTLPTHTYKSDTTPLLHTLQLFPLAGRLAAELVAICQDGGVTIHAKIRRP